MGRALTLRLSRRAQSDLAEIWSYIATAASADTADRLIRRIESACTPFLTFPMAGPRRDALAPGLRAAFAGNYAIYYRHDDRELVIVRVLHGARDVTAMAARGGFGEIER